MFFNFPFTKAVKNKSKGIKVLSITQICGQGKARKLAKLLISNPITKVRIKRMIDRKIIIYLSFFSPVTCLMLWVAQKTWQ